MSRADPTWLTRQGYEKARDELDRLLHAYRSGQDPRRGDDVAETEDQRERHVRRIRQLQELLLTSEVGSPPPDDGVAEPGMVLTVGHPDRSSDTFLLATRGTAVDEAMQVCSPQSPLGRALLGARVSETRSYRLPDGATTTVTLLHAEPFRE